MNRKVLLLSLGAMVAALVLSPSPAQATLVTIDKIIYQNGTGVTPSLMSGTLDLTISGGNLLTVVMRNTSADNAFTDSGLQSLMLLTGFGLQLTGVDIIGGTVEVTSGSTALNFGSQSTTVLGNQYNYANQAIDGYLLTGVPAVDSVVSSVNNGQATRFIGAPPTNINGPDFGALSALETQFGSSQAGVRDSITFVLTLECVTAGCTMPTVADIDAGNVVLAFGSPNAVPDGGMTAAMLGLAILGLGVLKRRSR